MIITKLKKKREEERECINNKYGKPRLGLGGLQQEEEGIEEYKLSL
jgi:hypothetical protein